MAVDISLGMGASGRGAGAPGRRVGRGRSRRTLGGCGEYTASTAGSSSLSGDRVRVRTKALRAPAGATVVVRIVQGGREVRLRRHTVGRRTTFSDAVRASGGGILTVRVRLAGPDGKPLARRPALRAAVLQPAASAGARGTRVRYLQRRLAALRYAVAVTGGYDDATRRAVIAFRKVNRMRRVGNASRAVFAMVARGRGGFRPRHRGAAHVEGDLTRQVLALVNRGGRVFKVYMTSSGRNGLNTPAGVHTFWRKEAGWNSERDARQLLFHPRLGAANGLRDPRLLRRPDLERQPLLLPRSRRRRAQDLQLGPHRSADLRVSLT